MTASPEHQTTTGHDPTDEHDLPDPFAPGSTFFDQPEVFVDADGFTHRHDCLCPGCFEAKRPDFVAVAKAIVTSTDFCLDVHRRTLGPDDAYAAADRLITDMHARLARVQACRHLWDFPDHFAVTTRRSPAVRGSGSARHLVTLLDVIDEHGHTVATLDKHLHGGGTIEGGRSVTALDDQRLHPDDSNSPVVVGYLRDWFDADQTMPSIS